MNALETYLRDVHEIRSTGAGAKETSYYPALANLLNAVGQTLKPRVRWVMTLKNQGPGCRTAASSPPTGFAMQRSLATQACRLQGIGRVRKETRAVERDHRQKPAGLFAARRFRRVPTLARRTSWCGGLPRPARVPGSPSPPLLPPPL